MVTIYTNVQRRRQSVEAIQMCRGCVAPRVNGFATYASKGASQRDLAKLVGADYYTFISQLETGRGRVPPDRCEVWAKALGIEPKPFVKTLLRFYDPVTYEILFEDKEAMTKQD